MPEWVLPALGLYFFCVTLSGIVVAGYACHMAIKANIEVKALQNSTHNIQYVPLGDPSGPDNDAEINDELSRQEREAYANINQTLEGMPTSDLL